MVGWHYQLNGQEFEQALGNGEGQGSLVCCSPWGRKESDTTERLNNNIYIYTHVYVMGGSFIKLVNNNNSSRSVIFQNSPDFFKYYTNLFGKVVLCPLMEFFNKFAGISFTYYFISADRIKHGSCQMVPGLN